MDLLRFSTAGSVDDGKSTLIGRLLYDTKSIFEDQLEAVEDSSNRRGEGYVNLALLTDGLRAEREQNITIDVAYRYFATPKRKFIIADTPGHIQYTRNMVTGASTAELAIILIDARNGVLTQSKRHGFISSLLGIPHILVAINKMDLVDWSEARYEEIADEYTDFAGKLGVDDLSFIPISALLGDNVVDASEHMPWYKGSTLLHHLEHVNVGAHRNLVDFRFPVQFVNRPNLDFRGYCGTVTSGIIRKGDHVTALPSGKSSPVKSIVTYDEELELAFTQMAVTLTLEDEIDISRGDMIVHSDNLPALRSEFTANIVWMNEKALMPGKQYDFKHTTKNTSGVIDNIRYKVDVNTLETSPSPTLELNEIGVCDISLSEAIQFDDYMKNPGTGSFIIIDRLTNVTVAAGMISDDHKTGKHVSTVSAHVTTEERAARFGQKPVTVMFIGLSGSGKSTLAHALERKLFDMGRVSTVLDGKQMRLGISKDLSHDAEGRAENLRRSAYIAKYLNDSGLICCAAFVAPNLDSREHLMSVIGEENCIVIYLNPPLDVCKQRDPSGLYAAEENVPTGTVPGVSFDYPEPENPDLILPTHELDVEDCIERVINVLKENSII